MRVGILGPLEIRDGSGRPVEVGGTRLRGLLARLALEPGRIVTTGTLIDGLWGDAPPASAANALQALVSRLRRALTPAGIAVDSQPAGYRLALLPPDVDAARAEGLVRDARTAGDPERAAALLREAVALWRGEALADLDELPFAGPAAVHLGDLRLTAVGALAEAELALGRAAEAVAVLAPFATLNLLRERLRGQYVRSLQAAGRPAEALAAYEETRRALADELGVDPSPELAALHLSLLRGDPPPAPVEAAGAATRRRPARRAALTSFVGRDDEVTWVAGMLTTGRLVTVVGPGGAGKTRLSLELADRVDGTGAPVAGLPALVPDGAWSVELAPLRDPQEVAYAVLAALGGADTALMDTRPERLRGRRDATERLVERLADAGLLLILDNCEHLTAAAAAVVDAVLAACPAVRVLATSREPLGVPGEMLAPLPSLGLPPPGTDPVRAAAYPALRLFADRAAAVRPGFAVDAATVDAIAQVCRRLDGMPLAIELAAARLRSLSVGEIADRLDDRFRLLTGGSRTALPRHQTLRAVVDWSWDLLGEAERAVARRLSVFPGAMTLAAAEEVCAGAGLPVVDIVDLVGSLVDKSLVELVDGGDDAAGPARYRLLETIRVYADERLAAAGETADVRARFVARVRRIVEEEEPRLLTADQLPAMARLTAERENVRGGGPVRGGRARRRLRAADLRRDGVVRLDAGRARGDLRAAGGRPRGARRRRRPGPHDGVRLPRPQPVRGRRPRRRPGGDHDGDGRAAADVRGDVRDARDGARPGGDAPGRQRARSRGDRPAAGSHRPVGAGDGLLHARDDPAERGEPRRRRGRPGRGAETVAGDRRAVGAGQRAERGGGDPRAAW